MEFVVQYHRSFDKLRHDGLLIGEMIWNFADFMTDQGIKKYIIFYLRI